MSFKYNIGDLVAIRNHPYITIADTENTTSVTYKGNIINCSSDNYPVMMIKECIQSITKKETLNAETGEVVEKAKVQRKYVCIWYDSFEGKFQEATLKEDVLVKIEAKLENPVKKEEVKEGDVVYFNTSLLERYKQIHNQNKQNDHYVPSSFLVIGKEYPSQYEWVNKHGFKERVTSSLMLKVKWFNVSKSRYSEELIPYECFQAQPQLIDRTLWDNLKVEQPTPLPSLNRLLKVNRLNYREQNSVDGISLEELIFFYIRSNRKMILDDRVNAFHKYLDINGYEIIHHRISLTSIGVGTYKAFRLPLDLILKDSNNKLHFVDILTGNSIVKDGNIDVSTQLTSEVSPEDEENTENEEYPVLSIYNYRMNIIKDLVEDKTYPDLSSFDNKKFKYKLLVINRNINNMIKVIEYKENPLMRDKMKKEIENVPVSSRKTEPNLY